MTADAPIKIKKGTRFFAQWADSNAEWEVLSARGSVCRCTIVSGDGKGVVRSFVKDEIRSILDWEAYLQKGREESAAFFESLSEGQIVHYHNLNKDFVRCRVVTHEGRKQLLPIALVGEWRFSSDYHRKAIENGSIWTPHASCVYEYPKFEHRHFFPNIATLDPIA